MKRMFGQDPEGAVVADAANRHSVPFGMAVIVVIVAGAMILIHQGIHQGQHTQDDLKTQVLTALRSRLPELSVPMWDDAIASQINRSMQTGDTVPHGLQCLGVPPAALTDVRKNERWALQHSILLEQTVGPYRDEKLGTRTQTCVVSGHIEAEPNVTIGKDNTGFHYLSVKVARIDDISIDVFKQTTYRDVRGMGDNGSASGYHVEFSGHVVPLYADIQISPTYFTGHVDFAETVQHNGHMEMLADPGFPFWNMTILP